MHTRYNKTMNAGAKLLFSTCLNPIRIKKDDKQSSFLYIIMFSNLWKQIYTINTPKDLVPNSLTLFPVCLVLF